MECLKIENLSNDYDGNKVLKNVNISVSSGEIIGYIGPNGAGKSTTIKIILGLNRHYSGEVYVLGQNIKESIDYKKRIGYVPESSDIYENLSAKENIELISALYGINSEDACIRAEKMLKYLFMEDVMDTMISSFSKGMKQKYLFVCSLLHDPDIIFLDEPLSGIDANSVLIIKEVLKRLKERGKTIFYSSHILEVVEKLSDRILLLDKGQVVLDGSIEDIKKRGIENSEDSLQDIFSEVTGFENHAQLAESFTELVKSDV